MIEHADVLRDAFQSYDDLELEQAEIQMKYSVYIDKEREMVERMGQMEDLEIPGNFDFNRVQAISAEAREN